MAEELIRRNAETGVELQLVTFATPGQPGGTPTLGMYTYPVPVVRYRPFFEAGVHLVTAGCHPAVSGSLLSPRIKHRSRLVWWLAEQALPAGAVAVLTADSGGKTFTETAIGSLLFVVEGSVVVSDPALVLDGISVRVVRELCETLRIPIRDERLTRTLLRTSSEVLLAGTGFGLAGVRRFDDEDIPWPGPVFQSLLAAWSELVGVDVAGHFLADV